MTELADLIEIARIDARVSSTRSNLITDAQIVTLTNPILQECRRKMVEVESNLVYDHTTVDTVADTGEYLISSFITDGLHSGFMQDGVWIDGEDWFLIDGKEEEKIYYDIDNSTNQPERYYLTSDGKMGFLWIPDDVYTVNIQYWLPLTKLTNTTGADGTVPWDGIWDEYVTKSIEYRIRRIYERDISIVALELVGIEAQAMQEVFRKGIRVRSSQSDMFTVDGV